MGRRRKKGTKKKGGPAGWVLKGACIGTLAGLVLCAAAAALVVRGVFPQSQVMTIGRIAAAAGVAAAGISCAWMAAEQKTVWAAACCGGMAILALIGNLLLIGGAGGAPVWAGAVLAGVLGAVLIQMRPAKRTRRRK